MAAGSRLPSPRTRTTSLGLITDRSIQLSIVSKQGWLTARWKFTENEHRAKVTPADDRPLAHNCVERRHDVV